MENAIVVTGARFVNLSWFDPAENAIQGSAWSVRPRGAMDEVMRAAQAIVAGFNPLQVRFSGDVNPAVHRVLVEGQPLLAPFSEHAAGTVHPALLRVAELVAGLRWTYSVPLRIVDGVVGALAYHYVDRPGAQTLRAAEAFAQQTALTLENARLSEALEKRAAQLEGSEARIAATQERVGREIAEVLGGRVATRILVATQRLLECRETARTDPDGAARMLTGIADEIDRIRDEDVRRASHRLHPSAIRIGLLPALQLLADGLEPQVEVTVQESATAAEADNIARNALAEPVRLGIYRFVEAALANVSRHSGARAARVDLDVSTTWLRARVIDTGRGFDPAVSGEGPGLRAMRDHVERLGGTVQIVSAPDSGTSVEAIVPIGSVRDVERRRFPRRAPSETAIDRQGTSDPLFQRIAENALTATGARFVTLSWYRAAEGTHELGAVAPVGLFQRAFDAARIVVPGFDLGQIRFRADANPLSRAVLIEGRPMLARTEEQAEGTIHPAVMRAAGRLIGMRWTHSVPLIVQGAVAGALAFHFADRPDLGTLTVAEALAKQVALTLENARLTVALRDHAEDLARSREAIASAEERTRRETAELLHGRVQTRLLVATHRLLEARSLLASDQEAARREMASVASELDRIREKDIERASRQLRPEALGLGLVIALRELADALAPRVDVHVEVSGDVAALDHPLGDALTPRVRLAVYRFVEEALANVAKHADAHTAVVRLDTDAERMRVSISDAGRGADPSAMAEGLGIRSMRERITRAGGSLGIESALGAGTTLTGLFPLAL